MPSGMDQNRLNDFTNVSLGLTAPSGGTAVLAQGFVAGASNRGHILLMTAMSATPAVTPGTELATSGSYVAKTGITYATGSSVFPLATYSSGASSTSNSTTLQQTGMPATTITGIEIWDSGGASGIAGNRWWYGSLSSQVATNNGDTLSFAGGTPGAIIPSLTG